MAKFKVGDRVRVIKSTFEPHIIGCAATITFKSDLLDDHWHLNVDGWGLRIPSGGNVYGEFGSHLAPLTPPEVTEWAAAKVKELGKVYQEPTVTKVKA